MVRLGSQTVEQLVAAGHEVAESLFPNRPAVGKAAYEVLRHNGCAVECPEVSCCGMPALGYGRPDLAIRQAKHNIALFEAASVSPIRP